MHVGKFVRVIYKFGSNIDTAVNHLVKINKLRGGFFIKLFLYSQIYGENWELKYFHGLLNKNMTPYKLVDFYNIYTNKVCIYDIK